jgi:hypothetical protein
MSQINIYKETSCYGKLECCFIAINKTILHITAEYEMDIPPPPLPFIIISSDYFLAQVNYTLPLLAYLQTAH